MINKLFLGAMIVALAATTALAAPVVFSNPFVDKSGVSYSSVEQSGSPLFTSFTDYNYDGSVAITDFHWWGLTADGADGFFFRIFSNGAGDMPAGNPLYEEFFAGNADQTFAGNDAFGLNVYKYSIDLTNPFTGPAGTYWFSVVASFPGQAGNWFWTQAGQYSGNLDWQYYTAGDEWSHPYLGPDLSFEITGASVVPEPTTLVLFGFSLLGGGALLRRKRSR